MKCLNIKQDIKEIKKSFKLLKDGVEDFIKKHLMFKQGLKSFFILLKWIILLMLIIYSFWYFPYLWKKLKVIEYQKNLTSLEQELQSCMDTYLVSWREIDPSYPPYSSYDMTYLPHEDPKIIAKSSDEEFDKYIIKTEQCESELLKQVEICHKKASAIERRASIIEKEKNSTEKQEVIKNLYFTLNSYISLQKSETKEYFYGRPDNYWSIEDAEKILSEMPKIKNKYTMSELKNKLSYYQEKLKKSEILINERKEVIKNLSSVLNSYISLQKSQLKEEYSYSLELIKAEKLFSEISEVKNKYTTSELKNKLRYYQKEIEILTK